MGKVYECIQFVHFLPQSFNGVRPTTILACVLGLILFNKNNLFAYISHHYVIIEQQYIDPSFPDSFGIQNFEGVLHKRVEDLQFDLDNENSIKTAVVNQPLHLSEYMVIRRC